MVCMWNYPRVELSFALAGAHMPIVLSRVADEHHMIFQCLLLFALSEATECVPGSHRSVPKTSLNQAAMLSVLWTVIPNLSSSA